MRPWCSVVKYHSLFCQKTLHNEFKQKHNSKLNETQFAAMSDYLKFSNSLIIHEEKTKEITTVKEVWICDPNYHKIQ